MNTKGSKALVFADSDNGGIVHVANIKGGVGKSTIATNLAAALSKRGMTLVIDLDVQGSATHAFGMDPSKCSASSWELLRRRFSPYKEPSSQSSAADLKDRLVTLIRKYESAILPQIVGRDEITSVAMKVRPCLDIIPATADLFKPVHFYHLQNLMYNLQICKNYYKYIVIDTPSVWNTLTRSLFIKSDLNLVPVTLNALSTKSLRDYLKNVRKLTNKNTRVRVRIVKNEVFGTEESKIKGKSRTMKENRQFLESLCEQVKISTKTGVSVLPQTILFDLEIPESAVVRDAQDEGKLVQDYRQYSLVSKAFDELAKRVQYVLNNPIEKRRFTSGGTAGSLFSVATKVCAVLILTALFFYNKPASDFPVPRPLAPQQLSVKSGDIIEYAFENGESLLRVSKYAICRFRAVVPTSRQIQEYILETIDIHNMTRMPKEKKIENGNAISRGTIVRFYPPSNIENPRADRLIPVYQYFAATVDDPYAYITGDWCERGAGGGSPHYGIDVASNLGTRIRSPVDGIAVLQDSKSAGRTVGIVKEGSVLFFAHLQQRTIKTGDQVKKGDVIGTVGMTGITSGPHVHIGYGIKTLSEGGTSFGRSQYRLTDPKLFFYREQYMMNADASYLQDNTVSVPDNRASQTVQQ